MESHTVLEAINKELPVFIQSNELFVRSVDDHFMKCLETIKIEDQSFEYRFDEDANQILKYGMEELHLEIINDLIVNEMKAQATPGTMRVLKEKLSEISIQHSSHDGSCGIFNKILLIIEQSSDGGDSPAFTLPKTITDPDRTSNKRWLPFPRGYLSSFGVCSTCFRFKHLSLESGGGSITPITIKEGIYSI